MAIGTPTSIGTRTTDGPNSGVNATIVTTAAVTAGNRIIVAVSYWDGGVANHRSTGISDPTNGAYALDKQSINGDDVIEIWSVHAAGGLVSGGTITVAFDASGTWGGIILAACQVSGIVTGAGYLDTTASANSTGSGWASGSASNIASEALYFGASGVEDVTAATTSTIVNGTELHDLYFTADQQGLQTGYRIETATAGPAATRPPQRRTPRIRFAPTGWGRFAR
jgi:hypothetical protein